MIRVRAYEDISRSTVNISVTQTREDPMGLHPATQWGLLIQDGISEWVLVEEGAEVPVTYRFSDEIGPLIYSALHDLYAHVPRGLIDLSLTRVEQILVRVERLVNTRVSNA